MIASPLRWHGGKKNLRALHISMFPKGYTRFVDACCGAMWVLFGLPQHEGVAEYANDINGDLMGFWDVLRHPTYGPMLVKWLQLTPLNQRDFDFARIIGDGGDSVDSLIRRAADYFVCISMSRQGLGKSFCTPTKRLRRNMNEQVSAWLARVDGLPEVVERLSAVELRCQPVREIIQELDSKKTFFYLDPPYLHETRQATSAYGYEMSDTEHESLLTDLLKIKGKFMLCGYPSRLYERYARHGKWHKRTIKVRKHSSSSKSKPDATEVVWTNYKPNA